ncbi:MAG TPA: nucleotidyltransferase domain-containing protein [Dissulfurispiraceae bacterium]|nr:nucleotidyltransferase domain-containing protein [Dissulfurispiraceae bacterium]
MEKTQLGVFEIYRRLHEDARLKALSGAKYLYAQGARKVFLFGSIVKPEFFMRESDIDIAVEGIPDGKSLTVEAGLIDILYPYDFDLIFLDSKDVIAREEIIEAVKRDGVCIEKFC